MDLSGKLIHRVAVFEGGITPEQNQELASLAEKVLVIRDRVWQSFEEFVEAHSEQR